MANEGYYFPDPGHQECKCGVCSQVMKVTRNLEGYTSWSSAMARKERKYDAFICPHIEDKWHKQALALMKLAQSTPSYDLSIIYYSEAEKIIAAMQHTKEHWNDFS